MAANMTSINSCFWPRDIYLSYKPFYNLTLQVNYNITLCWDFSMYMKVCNCFIIFHKYFKVWTYLKKKTPATKICPSWPITLERKKTQTALNSLEITVSKQNNIIRNRVYLIHKWYNSQKNKSEAKEQKCVKYAYVGLRGFES